MSAIRSVLIALVSILLGSDGVTANARQTQDVEIKTWPQLKQPTLAKWFNWAGYCEVNFAVDENGVPFEIRTFCSRRIFCFDANRAISAARFHPKLIGGNPRNRRDLMFPFHYSLDGEELDVETLKPTIKPCEARPTS